MLVVVDVRGGVVEGVCSDAPCQVIVVDHDAENADFLDAEQMNLESYEDTFLDQGREDFDPSCYDEDYLADLEDVRVAIERGAQRAKKNFGGCVCEEK